METTEKQTLNLLEKMLKNPAYRAQLGEKLAQEFDTLLSEEK